MGKGTFENHPSLYLVDGNIVLVAPRSANDSVVFRVHRSILAKLSCVFESMFSIPNGDLVEEYDGVPVVYMTDSAEQLEKLLMVLYHEVYLPFKPLDPCTPNFVKPVLLLANKYAMDQIRVRIVEHIEQDWPITLRLWDTLESQIKESLPDDHLPEPASAIRLARECNIPSILPAAFYHLSRLSVFDNGNGAYDDGRRTAEWDLLSAQDLLCLMKGRRRLEEAVHEIPSDFPGCGECTTIDRLAVFKEIRDVCQHVFDVLRVTRFYAEKHDYYKDKICSICYFHFRSNLARFREKLWTNLPNFFYL